MSSYEIEFTKSAQKELYKLPTPLKIRVVRSLHALSANPRAGSVRSMVGSKSWRLRVGDYRVIYDIVDTKLLVLVIRIRHRREVYRK